MKVAILLALVLSNTLLAKESVVYGDDNRKDIYETYNYLHKLLAESTAGMVNNKKITKNSGRGSVSITAKHKLGKAFKLCSSERFKNQKLLANCSGFLVNEDTLVTAGHCVTYDEERPDRDVCRDYSWVFGLSMDSSTSINLTNISKDRVYKCKKVLKVKWDRYEDYAVIKLDRKVVGRKPLKYRTSGKVRSSTKLVVIGHPSMLPTKVSDNGSIIDNTDHYKFYTNLDTFQGNSGSAVFNSKTGLLEGILVSGKTDYTLSRPLDPKSCRVVNTCSTSGRRCEFKPEKGKKEAKGEAVTRITNISRYFRYN